MADRILESNLKDLENHFPELAGTLRRLRMDELHAEIVPTKTNAPSIRIYPPARGKPELLHSAYDPIREAQRWAESADVQSPINVVVLGAGLGYHLLSLVKMHFNLLRHIIVIEADPRILRLAFSTLDLRALINREGTYFFAGTDPEQMPELLKDARPDLIIHNCKILPHTPSLRCHPDYYNRAREILLQTLTYDEVNMRTNMGNQGRNQFNLYMNLPAIARGYALKDCADLFRGYPAIVAAAGPSLDKNVRLLHDLGDRALMLIVDTAQNTFHKLGLAHDVVVTGDPTPLNYSHFERVDSLGEAFLAFHPEVQRTIAQKFVDHPYLLPLFDPNIKLTKCLFDLDRYGTMERAMNVGHLAVNLALHMGCAPIILVGFDFAFPRNGGTTHAADAAVSRAMKPMLADGTIDIDGKEGKAPVESGKMSLVPGYYGDEVPTTVPFSLYIRALEKTVGEYPQVEFIDATEGGAYFQGTQRMPLQEAMHKYLTKPGVNERLLEFKNRRPQPPYQSVIDRLTEGRGVLTDSMRRCEDLLALIEQWRALAAQRAVDLKEAHQRWNEFEAIWIEICGQELFEPFLGGSAQHIYFMRQRAAKARDNSGNAFLELVGQKYSTLVPELKNVIANTIQCVDLSIAALNARRQSL